MPCGHHGLQGAGPSARESLLSTKPAPRAEMQMKQPLMLRALEVPHPLPSGREQKASRLTGKPHEAQVLLRRLGIYFHSPLAELEPLIKADSMNTIKFRGVAVKRTGSLTDH